MVQSILRRLKVLEAENHSKKTLVCLLDGREITTNILDAAQKGAVFLRTVSGNHDYDELHRALLSGNREIDCSDLPEVR